MTFYLQEWQECLECNLKGVKRIIFYVLWGLLPWSGYSQGDQSSIYAFNDCSGTDDSGFAPQAQIDGSPGCQCGVDGNGLLLDGNNDRILLADTVRELMEDDFTVRFYFTVENTEGMVDLFSYRTTCDKDSSMSVSYTPITNLLRVEFGRERTEIFQLDGRLDQSKCWHQVTVTRFNLEYALYIDGELIAAEQADREVVFGRNAKIAIANSPCLAFIQDRLSGVIDEVEIYNYALSPFFIADSYLDPDRIVSEDITIFKDEQATIETGVTCASQITWVPSIGLDDPQAKNPVVTGVETTDYAVAFNNGNCISRDTVRVNVVDPDQLQCEDLLLPNAFTPNNDGLNDIYGISNKFLVQDLLSFEIYNRSGTLVFKSTDISQGWDGNFNGKSTDPGMFLYKISYRCGGQEYLKVDNFSVIR